MRINVQYTTQIKAALGVAQEAIELPPRASISELLDTLNERHAEPFRRLVFTPEGTLLPSVLLCVDDQQVDPASSDPLTDGATVTFLSAISGG